MDLVTLELTIPSDWTPGTKLIWLSPSNKRIQIDVPPNAAPGTDIDFEVPRAILDDPAKAALRAEYAKPSVAPWLEARRGKLDATEKYSLAAVREKVDQIHEMEERNAELGAAPEIVEGGVLRPRQASR